MGGQIFTQEYIAKFFKTIFPMNKKVMISHIYIEASYGKHRFKFALVMNPPPPTTSWATMSNQIKVFHRNM